MLAWKAWVRYLFESTWSYARAPGYHTQKHKDFGLDNLIQGMASSKRRRARELSVQEFTSYTILAQRRVLGVVYMLRHSLSSHDILSSTVREHI